MKAIVVDDSLPIRVLLGNQLSSLGFSVDSYPSGESAFDALVGEDSCPDVVLVDWNMPGMNGIELIEAVRSQGRFTELFMVMVTSEARVTHMAKAFESGVDEYLTKPFSSDSLQKKLELLGFSWADDVCV